MNRIPPRASLYTASREPRPASRVGLRGVILGLDDGLVTTLVTVMALTNAATHLLVVMIGVVLASAISMALGGFASAYLEHEAHPVMQGLQTGGAFLVGGAAPLIPVALQVPFVQWWSYACTALVALAFGVFKSQYDGHGRSVLSYAAFFLIIVTVGTLAGVGIGEVLR